MSYTLLQAEGSLYKELHQHLYAVKKFIAWKRGKISSHRDINLFDPSTLQDVVYSKEEKKK